MHNINKILSYLPHDLNKLYDSLSMGEKSFRKNLVLSLKQTLNKAMIKKVLVEIQKVKGLSDKELVRQFKRFYDHWFSFELECFYLDNPTDNYETLRLFSNLYAIGAFGTPSYLSDKMVSPTRDGRLVELVAMMEEEEQALRLESRPIHLDDY
jgi:hypothetical protein